MPTIKPLTTIKAGKVRRETNKVDLDIRRRGDHFHLREMVGFLREAGI